MRLKMQISPALALAMWLAGMCASQNIYPIQKPVGFGSFGDSMHFVKLPNDQKNVNGQVNARFQPGFNQTETLDSNNDKKEKDSSFVESIEPESAKNKALDKNSGTFTNENVKETPEFKTFGLLDKNSGTSTKQNEKETPESKPFGLLDMNSGSFGEKNEKPDNLSPIQLPISKLILNDNKTLEKYSGAISKESKKYQPMKLPSDKLDSNQRETLDLISDILANKNEEQDNANPTEIPETKLEANQEKTVDNNSGSLDNKKDKQSDDQPLEVPTFIFESNQNKSENFNLKKNKSTKKFTECPLTTLDCLCFADKVIEHVIHVDLKTISAIDPRTGLRRCFADEDPVAACEKRKCVIIPNNNFETLFQKGKKAYPSNHLDNIEEIDTPLENFEKNDTRQDSGSFVLDSLLSAFYPVEYTYPRAIGEFSSRVARSVYGSNLCRVPALANSEVTCWKWPNWQTCKQTCIYGHGLDNGGKTIKQKSFNCRNTENKWKPHIIRDCEPYMNCKVHLKSPGDLNCVEPTDGPAYCDINCADYDDYVGHGKVRWKCEEKAMIHGKGGKQNKLPHCAEFEEADLRLGPPDY